MERYHGFIGRYLQSARHINNPTNDENVIRISVKPSTICEIELW